MPNAKIGKVNLSDTVNTQRLRFNQLIDSVGSVSITNVNQTAGRSTFAGSYPTVAEALKEHEARLDSADIIEVRTPRIRAFDNTYDNTLAGNTFIQSNLDVTGITTLDSTTIDGTLLVTNTSQFNKEVTIDEALTVTDSAYITGNLNIGANLDVTGNVQIDGNLTVDGIATLKAGADNNINLGDINATTDTVTFNAEVASHIIPDGDNTYDLGSASKEWRHGYFDGTVDADEVNADSATLGTVKVSDLTAGRVVLAGTNGEIEDTAKLTFHDTDGLNINEALSVSDSAQITGTLNVDGDITATANANITGRVNIDGDLTVTDSAYITGNVNIGGDLDIIGTVTSTGTAFTLAAETGTNDPFTLGDTLTVAAGEGINTAVTNNTITVSGEDASDTNKGISKFDNGDFVVTNGNVTLADLTTGAVLGISGTASEIEVSRTNGTVTVGLPTNVTIAGDLGIGNDFTVGGNFTVTGAQKLSTAFVELMDGTVGTPSSTAGVSIDRGTEDSALMQWNETGDYWEASYNNAATPSQLVTYANLDTTDFSIGSTISISDEAIQDMVGAMVTGNTESNITVTYQDGDGTLDFSLNNTTVSPGTYGSTTSIPTLTVDAQGRLTNVTPVSIATNLNITDDAANTDAVSLLNDTLTFSEGEGINVTVSNNKVTVTGELATSSNKGVASFSTDNFSVSNGVVTIKDNGVILGTETTGNYMSGISGTANEVEVSHTPGEGSTATVGLPNSVTITTNLTTGQDIFVGRNLDVTGNTVIDGNLTVSGTTTTVNTETVTIADNIILLNSDATGTPTENGGIEIERGSSTNVQLRWNEANDYWQIGEGNDPVYTRVATAGWLNVGGGLTYNSTTGQFAHTDTSSQTSVNNTGNTFIQDVSVDAYGHITDLVSGTVTVGDGTVTLSAGTYLNGGDAFTTNQSGSETITFNHDNTTRTNTTSTSSPGFGGTFTLIDSLTSNATGHVTGSNTRTITLPSLPTYDNYVSWTFLEGNGTESGTITSGDTLHFEQGPGMEVEMTADDQLTFTNTDRGSSQYIFKNIIPEAADGSDLNVITADNNNDTFYIRAGGGITLASDAINDRMTISHTDTSSQASSNNSGRTYIQDITLDTYGHVTGINTATETVTDTNRLTTFIVQDGDGTNVTISQSKHWKFREGSKVDINWTDVNSGASSDPYDLTFSLKDGPQYIDVATGTYGTVKVDDDRGVTWAGYAIRDDWVFMSNGADQSGIYNDTDNEWAATFVRNGATTLFHNGLASLATVGNNGIRVGSTTSSDIYMQATDDTERRIHCDSDQIGFLRSDNAWGFYVDNNGNVVAAGNVSAQSDRRVKSDIKTIENPLDKVLALRGVNFVKEGNYEMGVIAQEVEEVIPEVVGTTSTKTVDNPDGLEDLKTVSYGNMVGVLIEAMKEQQQQIEKIKNEIDLLKSK
jgi:UDP-3-O-[3-hydroxymyristoyl] glucosamine N-acyltransferase